MINKFDFNLPQIDNLIPVWDGNIFTIGNKCTPVLQYSSNLSGWDDGLTNFHEDSAGDNHFIDLASRKLAIKALRKNLQINEQTSIIEIGCSSGYMLNDLKNNFNQSMVIGADIVEKPLFDLAAKLPNTPLLQFDLLKCPLPNACVDAVVMLNVLEHIEDDVQALQQAYRLLRPGGILVIEVPAGPLLYDIYDKQLLHFRRYSEGELKKKVQQVGFQISKSSHLGFFIYPGFWYVKNKNKKLNTLSKIEQQKIVEKNIKSTHSSKVLKFLINSELFLYDYMDFPIGIRCIMTCIKK